MTSIMPMIHRSCVSALASLVCTLPVVAQELPGADSAHVLILGTYHFANPGLDIVQTEVADVLSATKQAEINAVLEALVRFRPTRIAVEQVPATAPRLDSIYDAYRSGSHELGRDETQQLGFRLAAMLEHPRVYPIDHRGEFPFGAVMEYAQVHDSAFVAFVHEELARITVEANRQQREHTVAEILRMANEPTTLAGGHGSYIRFARVGAGDGFVGAALLSRWYERNIHIFANLQRIAERGDRILVIVGSGHAPILRELVAYDPTMVLVDVLEYLPPRTAR
jgi:hypothetical protein